MRIFRRRRNRNTLGDMASAPIAKGDTPAGAPTFQKHGSSVSAQDFLKQCIVTLAGCVIVPVHIIVHNASWVGSTKAERRARECSRTAEVCMSVLKL